MILINLLLIQLIIVYILDLSGVVNDGIQPFFIKHFKHKMRSKPFLCSRCQTFWIGLTYIIIVHQFTLPYIAYVCLLSFLTPVAQGMLWGIYDALVRFFQ